MTSAPESGSGGIQRSQSSATSSKPGSHRSLWAGFITDRHNGTCIGARQSRCGRRSYSRRRLSRCRISMLYELLGFGAEFRRNEFVVEFLLLIRIEDRANLQIGRQHQTASLTLQTVLQLCDLIPRILHHLDNLFPLRRIEVQRLIHPVNKVRARKMNQLVPVGERAAGKANRKPRSHCCREQNYSGPVSQSSCNPAQSFMPPNAVPILKGCPDRKRRHCPTSRDQPPSSQMSKIRPRRDLPSRYLRNKSPGQLRRCRRQHYLQNSLSASARKTTRRSRPQRPSGKLPPRFSRAAMSRPASAERVAPR